MVAAGHTPAAIQVQGVAVQALGAHLEAGAGLASMWAMSTLSVTPAKGGRRALIQASTDVKQMTLLARAASVCLSAIARGTVGETRLT